MPIRRWPQVAQIREEREGLAQWLSSRGYQVAPSASNFLLFGPVPKRQEVWQHLVDRGVLIRVCWARAVSAGYGRNARRKRPVS